MTNRVTISGTLLDDPRVRTYETRKGTFESVSLWVEVKSEHRTDRFSVDIACPKQGHAAKAMRKDVIVEINGKLRHDRWKDAETSRWTGKVYIAVDPGEGTVRSKGLAAEAKLAEAA